VPCAHMPVAPTSLGVGTRSAWKMYGCVVRGCVARPATRHTHPVAMECIPRSRSMPRAQPARRDRARRATRTERGAEASAGGGVRDGRTVLMNPQLLLLQQHARAAAWRHPWPPHQEPVHRSAAPSLQLYHLRGAWAANTCATACAASAVLRRPPPSARRASSNRRLPSAAAHACAPAADASDRLLSTHTHPADGAHGTHRPRPTQPSHADCSRRVCPRRRQWNANHAVQAVIGKLCVPPLRWPRADRSPAAGVT
jgi:hypothetical protein